MKLHIKFTSLVSAITLAIMSALLLVISARLVDLVRADEKALAEAEATGLAEHLSQSSTLPEATELEGPTELIRSTRLDEVAVRVWETTTDGFKLKWSTNGNAPHTEMPPAVTSALRENQVARIESGRAIETSDSFYRIFAPIVREKKVIGAVEINDHLDNLPTILKRLFGTTVLLAFLALGLIALATYIMFRDLFYRPIERLLEVIAQAKLGIFNVQAPEHKTDEFGRLSQEFNEMLGKIHDMTTEREHQQEVLRERIQEATAQLEQRNDQLASANQELWRTTRRLTQLERLAAAGQMAAQFAHEVGTPLNLISCHSQLLHAEADANPASVRERAEIIIEQTERIERIVRRMLDRTRPETVEHSLLDLNGLIRRIAEAMAPILLERGVKLYLSLDDDLPQIAGDSDKLQQVFINLINNALDAMPGGGRLAIRTEPEHVANGHQPRTLVSLTDTGCGMTSDVQAHIFDPLYTTKQRGKGAGLGLVVVNQVMQEHNGTVTVKSLPDRGSRFLLSFPSVAPLRRMTERNQFGQSDAHREEIR